LLRRLFGSGQRAVRSVSFEVDQANRKAEVGAELTKRLDVKRPDIRARGHY